jgi:hypothetical protein
MPINTGSALIGAEVPLHMARKVPPILDSIKNKNKGAFDSEGKLRSSDRFFAILFRFSRCVSFIFSQHFSFSLMFII